MRYSVGPTTVSALNTWAAQKRQLLIEETPLTSVLAKIKVERVAAGEGEPGHRQKWPEVYRGDGALVQKVVRTLRELPRITLTFYYVLHFRHWRVSIPDQANEIGISKREYYRQLEIAETAVDTGLQLVAEITYSVRTPELVPSM